jgi:hypothetical protein
MEDEQVEVALSQQLLGEEVGIPAVTAAAVDDDGILRARPARGLEGEQAVVQV